MRTRQDDELFMREAISLAQRGTGTVHPNPLVGALLVRSGAIVGRGWHRRAGGPHAEVEAIESARDAGLADLSDCTLYVTLLPSRTHAALRRSRHLLGHPPRRRRHH